MGKASRMAPFTKGSIPSSKIPWASSSVWPAMYAFSGTGSAAVHASVAVPPDAMMMAVQRVFGGGEDGGDGGEGGLEKKKKKNKRKKRKRRKRRKRRKKKKSGAVYVHRVRSVLRCQVSAVEHGVEGMSS